MTCDICGRHESLLGPFAFEGFKAQWKLCADCLDAFSTLINTFLEVRRTIENSGA